MAAPAARGGPVVAAPRGADGRAAAYGKRGRARTEHLRQVAAYAGWHTCRIGAAPSWTCCWCRTLTSVGSLNARYRRAAPEPEEPDYAAATTLGADAIPHLQSIVQGDDAMLASKAVYLAGLISDLGSREVVETAAHHANPAVRVAAAAAAGSLPADAASDLLVDLVTDSDPGVRKVARSSVPEGRSDALAQRLAEAPGEAGEDEGTTGTPEPVILDQPMPGEGPGRATMPGESSGLMPGESQGRMPGEIG